MLDCEHRIWVEAVSLVTRILHSSQGEENLCRELLQVEVAMSWPGLTREVREICMKVGLPDATKKYVCRKDILEYIQYFDMKMVKENMSSLDKCKKIRERDCRFVQP